MNELVQEMKEELLERLEEIICDNVGNCTDDSEIELRNSSVTCLDSEMTGIFSAILSRPNAEMVQLLRNFSLNLEDGTILTLSSICESEQECLQILATTITNHDHIIVKGFSIAKMSGIISVVVVTLIIIIIIALLLLINW